MAEIRLSISFIFKVKSIINFSEPFKLKNQQAKRLQTCFFFSMPFVEEKIVGTTVAEKWVTDPASLLLTENN